MSYFKVLKIHLFFYLRPGNSYISEGLISVMVGPGVIDPGYKTYVGGREFF